MLSHFENQSLLHVENLPQHGHNKILATYLSLYNSQVWGKYVQMYNKGESRSKREEDNDTWRQKMSTYTTKVH